MSAMLYAFVLVLVPVVYKLMQEIRIQGIARILYDENRKHIECRKQLIQLLTHLTIATYPKTIDETFGQIHNSELCWKLQVRVSQHVQLHDDHAGDVRGCKDGAANEIEAEHNKVPQHA